MRKNQQKTQLIKLCTKGRVKKKTNRITHKKNQNEMKERAAKLCSNALTST